MGAIHWGLLYPVLSSYTYGCAYRRNTQYIVCASHVRTFDRTIARINWYQIYVHTNNLTSNLFQLLVSPHDRQEHYRGFNHCQMSYVCTLLFPLLAGFDSCCLLFQRGRKRNKKSARRLKNRTELRLN